MSVRVAVIKRVIYSNHDYYVLDTDIGKVVVYSDFDPKVKKTYIFTGEEVSHPGYGSQFKADSIKKKKKIPVYKKTKDEDLFNSNAYYVF